MAKIVTRLTAIKAFFSKNATRFVEDEDSHPGLPFWLPPASFAIRATLPLARRRPMASKAIATNLVAQERSTRKTNRSRPLEPLPTRRPMEMCSIAAFGLISSVVIVGLDCPSTLENPFSAPSRIASAGFWSGHRGKYDPKVQNVEQRDSNEFQLLVLP
jgi:hypothetical protein